MHESVKPDVWDVLLSLTNSADGLSFREEGVRYVVGNTNWNVLRKHIDDARAILADRARSPQDAKPVAWRTRGMNAAGRWLPWQMINEAQASRWRDDSSFAIGRREIEPLYATPPLAIEALREALKQGDLERFAYLLSIQLWLHCEIDVLGQSDRLINPVRDALKSLGDSDGR